MLKITKRNLLEDLQTPNKQKQEQESVRLLLMGLPSIQCLTRSRTIPMPLLQGCIILCCDVGGCTLGVANIYGWTGGCKGTKEATRTVGLIMIIRMQFSAGQEEVKGSHG